MFNLKTFVINNLYNGYINGSFSYEQAAIYATNYMTKGIIAESDVEELMAKIDAYKAAEEETTEDEATEETTEV